MDSFFKRINILIICIGIISFVLVPNAFSISKEPKTNNPYLISSGSLGLWKIEKHKGDTVSLHQTSGILQINYDVNVNHWKQWGIIGDRQTSFELLLKRPLPLNSSIRHIIYEAFGNNERLGNEGLSTEEICPLIEDKNQEIFTYFPTTYPDYLIPNPFEGIANCWNTWMSPGFYSTEAGGASQDVYKASGGKEALPFPVGGLKFIGFKIIVKRLNNYGRTQDSIALGKISFCGVKIPYRCPYFYADSLLKEKGQYKFLYKITNEFQGLPVIQGEKEISYSPENIVSKHQQIFIPFGPDDSYWVTYQIVDKDGKSVAENSFRYIVHGNSDKTPVKPVLGNTAPVLGYMYINPEKHTTGVYNRNEPLKVIVRIFPKDEKKSHLSLTWKVSGYLFNMPVLQKGSEEIGPTNKRFIDIPIIVKDQPDRDAYRLSINLSAGNTIIDKEDYLLGKKTDLNKPYLYEGRPGKLFFNRNYVKKAPFIHVDYIPPEYYTITTENQLYKDFCKKADQISLITKYINYEIDLRDLEVLPGVYDFTLLDKIVDAAADRGMAVMFTIAHGDQNGQYNWEKTSPQYAYDGQETMWMAVYGSYSVADPQNTKIWEDACRAIYDRYKDNPGWLGYYLLASSGEGIVDDEPWKGLFTGYEKPFQQAFRTWLKQKYINLNTLNKTWNTHYKDWSQVQAPAPEFTLGAKPDLRMSWVDFCKFKNYMNTDYWFPTLCKSIRKYDSNHVIVVYGTPNKVEGLADYGHNGGNTFMPNDIGCYVNAWKKYKTGWITEPSQPFEWADGNDPNGLSWTLDWSIWVMTAQAGAGGENLHVWWDPYQYKDGLVGLYGGNFAYDRLQKYEPILNELHDMTLIIPSQQIAVLQDPYTLWCKEKTTFTPRLADLSRWFELLTFDGVPYEKFNPDKISDYKLILPNILDEVESEKNINLLVTAVKKYGAKMIICANTGEYCPEEANKRFVLLRALGINPPEGLYNLTDRNVFAEVTADNPLFSKGTKIKFYTLADFSHDLRSDTLKNYNVFWNFPYRFIPETNYFGYYKNNKNTNGKVLARFSNGSVALSLNKIGKGEVIVFWGTPDYREQYLKGMMAKAAVWAKVKTGNLTKSNPLLMLEGYNKTLDRWYILLYDYGDIPGTYYKKFPDIPAGDWFVDELVSDEKLGTYTGEELRNGKLPITYIYGYSPLKIFRLSNPNNIHVWLDKYRLPPSTKKNKTH